MTAAKRRVPLPIVACALIATVALIAVGYGDSYRTFPSPQDAVRALADAAKESSLDDLLAIFGPEGRDLVASSDPATARRNREVFSAAVTERWQLVDDGANRKTLVIGNEAWPFPVPLVKDG